MKKFVQVFFIIFAATFITLSASAQIFSSEEKKFDNPLIDAADKGNYDQVVELVKAGNFVDSRGNFDVTALMRAAFKGDKKIVDFLISAGANVNAADIGGATALHLASRQGQFAVIDSLLKAGAIVDISDNEGWTPLMRAASAKKSEAVETLVKAGANVNAANQTGETPLMHAAQGGNLKIVKLLMESGAKVNARSETGKTADRFANRLANKDVEKAIIQRREIPASMENKEVAIAPTPVPAVTAPEVPKTEEVAVKEENITSAPEPVKLEPKPISETPAPEIKASPVENISEPVKEVAQEAQQEVKTEEVKLQESTAEEIQATAPEEVAKAEVKEVKPVAELTPAELPVKKEKKVKKVDNRKLEKLANTTPLSMQQQVSSDANFAEVKPAIANVSGAIYMVQLGKRFNTNLEAQDYLQKVKTENAEIFGASTLYISKAAKTNKYRVRAGAFEARRNAVSTCTSLMLRGVPCSVVETTTMPTEITTIVKEDNVWKEPVPVVAQQAVIEKPKLEQVSSLEEDSSVPLSMRRTKTQNIEIVDDTKANLPPQRQEFDLAPKNSEPNKKERIIVANKIDIAPVNNVSLQKQISEEDLRKLSEQTAKVTVAEAIRVPAGELQPHMVKPSSLVRPAGDYSPSDAVSAKSFSVEFKTFSVQEEAASFFDEVTVKSGKNLRIKIITSYDGTVSLRLAGFKTAREALDFCKYREQRSCNLVNEISTSPIIADGTVRKDRTTFSEIITAESEPKKEMFWMHFGSFENEEEAINIWRNISETNSDILSRISPNVSKPELSSANKEIFRLRAGPFDNRDVAAGICDKLKRRSVSCLTVIN